MCPYLVTGFWRFRNPATRRGREKRVTPRKKSPLFKAKWPFLARRSSRGKRNYRISTHVGISGVNGPKSAHFCPKFGSHFMGPTPRKTSFSASAMGDFAGVRLSTGSRQSRTTSIRLKSTSLPTWARNKLPFLPVTIISLKRNF